MAELFFGGGGGGVSIRGAGGRAGRRRQRLRSSLDKAQRLSAFFPNSAPTPHPPTLNSHNPPDRHPPSSAEFAFDLALPWDKIGHPGSFRLMKRAGVKVDYKF